jgi:hypothetical protein
MPLAALAILLAADFTLGVNLTPAQASNHSLFFDVAFSAFAISSTIARTLIVVRQRRNVIGWLLLAVPLWAAFAFAAGDYATYALVTVPGSLPLGRAAAWIDRWAIVPTLSIPILLFLLFPDGRVPSRRWPPVLWLACAAPAVTALLFALTPGRALPGGDRGRRVLLHARGAAQRGRAHRCLPRQRPPVGERR